MIGVLMILNFAQNQVNCAVEFLIKAHPLYGPLQPML